MIEDSGSDMDFTYVQDLDVIEVGNYHLVCTATPGHSPGHMCLYEPEHGIWRNTERLNK